MAGKILKNTWRIACPSVTIDAGKAKAVRVFDKNIVVFRGKLGKVTALIDRCAHNGVPLSSGSVLQRHNRIKSPTHGWEYDATGKCVFIPSLPEGEPIPEKARVQSFKTFESDGYIWVWMGDQEPTSEPEPFPSIERYHWKQATFNVECDPQRALEHHMDITRIPFMHKDGYLGKWLGIKGAEDRDLQDRSYELRITPSGFIVFEPTTNLWTDEPKRDSFQLEFGLPDRVVFKKLGKRNLWANFQDHLMIAHFVPILHENPLNPSQPKVTTRAEYMYTPFAPGLKLGREKLAVAWTKDKLIQKDIKTLEQIEKSMITAKPLMHPTEEATSSELTVSSQAGDNTYELVSTDQAIATLRKIVSMAADSDWNETSRANLTQRTIVKYRG